MGMIEIISSSYNMGYHIVELAEPDDGVDIYYFQKYADTDQWCVESFGGTDFWGKDPKNGWKRMRNKYYFTSEEKMVLFLLRWS